MDQGTERGRRPVRADCRGAAVATGDELHDGEAIVRRPDGNSDFHALRSCAGAAEAILVAFDLVELDGRDFRREPLEVRRTLLAALIDQHARVRGSDPNPAILFSVSYAEDGAEVLAQAAPSDAGDGGLLRLRCAASAGLGGTRQPDEPNVAMQPRRLRVIRYIRKPTEPYVNDRTTGPTQPTELLRLALNGNEE